MVHSSFLALHALLSQTSQCVCHRLFSTHHSPTISALVCLPLPNKPGPLSMSQSHNPISQHPPRPKLKPLTDDPLSNRLNFQFRRLRLRARRPGCTSRRTIRPDGHSTRRLLPQRKLRAAEETRLCVVFSRLGVDRGECAA